MRTSGTGAVAAIPLRIPLLQEIWDEPLHETSNETDDQHHLPCQGAAAEIGIPDLEAWQDATSQEQEQNPSGDHADQKTQRPIGHVVYQICIECDRSAPDRECDGECCTDQARLGSKPKIAGSWLKRIEPAGYE